MQVGHRDPPRAERKARRPYVSFQQFDSNLQHFLSALADLSPSLPVMEICASQVIQFAKFLRLVRTEKGCNLGPICVTNGLPFLVSTLDNDLLVFCFDPPTRKDN